MGIKATKFGSFIFSNPATKWRGLRHNAATIRLNHFGTASREIQNFLRLKNIRTTVRYTQVCYVAPPLLAIFISITSSISGQSGGTSAIAWGESSLCALPMIRYRSRA